ncbi:MAG: hypothetical protein E4H20_04270 [Spirochaetales bacterium]|nr:MAG: hypothetical protein E4H20_04270 [Spirochaetales bacterium]
MDKEAPTSRSTFRRMIKPILAFLLVTATSLPALERLDRISSVRLDPSPDIAALLAADTLDLDLAQAGLILSGTREIRAAATSEALSAAKEEAILLAANESDDYRLGEAVLALAHKRFLKRYVEAESTLDAAILDGRYNCVSSSVVYLILARAAGLDVFGIVTRDHSFAALKLRDGRLVDVETTNPFGYDPGSKKQFMDSFGRTTGYAYVPPSDYRNRRAVGSRHLIGLIAWNRATLMERGGDHIGAIELAVDAYAYMADDEARTYLGDRIHNAVALLLNARRWTDAITLMERAERSYGALADLPSLMSQARLARFADDLSVLSPDEAMTELEAADRAGIVSAGDRADFIAYIYGRKADEARKKGTWFDAWTVLQEGSALAPDSASLQAMTKTARANWVAETHNLFAALFNAGRYAEALATIEAGQSVAPDERIFAQDVEALRRAMKQ